MDRRNVDRRTGQLAARSWAGFGLGCLVVSLVLGTAMPAAAQTVDIGGFLKSSYYYDTRQMDAAREGDHAFYPLPETIEDGEDVNETGNLLFFPFFSRMTFSIGDLPEVGGAIVSGYFEADFFGASNAVLNSLRMRRGFVKLEWERHEAVFGMDWSPTFAGVWPRTVATEAGSPYQTFARLPQARYTFAPDGYRFHVVAAQQRDAFSDIGGRKQQQQAELPTLMGFAELRRERFVLGAGGWVKWIRPDLAADRFEAFAVQGYFDWQPSGFALRGKATWGEDLADQLLTGGYVLVDDGTATPLQTFATWLDVESTGRGVGFGVFGGYFTNLGAGTAVEFGGDAQQLFARGADIEYGWRVSPRVVWNAEPLRFAFELPVDTALYASSFDEELTPTSTDDDDPVTNVRADLSVFLFF